jgi:hypothetical protein
VSIPCHAEIAAAPMEIRNGEQKMASRGTSSARRSCDLTAWFQRGGAGRACSCDHRLARRSCELHRRGRCCQMAASAARSALVRVRDGLAGWGREDSNLCISESEFAKTLPSRRQDSKLCISESEFAKTLSSGPEHSTVGCGAKASNDCKIHEDRLDGVHHVCSPMLGTRADVAGNRCRRSSPAASSH